MLVVRRGEIGQRLCGNETIPKSRALRSFGRPQRIEMVCKKAQTRVIGELKGSGA